MRIIMSKRSDRSLTVVSQIDEGSFGKIFLVRKNGGSDDGKIYAMKNVPTTTQQKNYDQLKICYNELNMLKLVQRAPFLIQLKYACTSINEYHFVMDYMPAGNLYNYMIGGTLTLSEAKICGAEILLALQYLHKHHVVYRDLKLENILIEAGGHILLTDFGLARTLKNNEKLTDKAGTVTYFAPEMLSQSKRHSFEVDWWTLGITLYELLVGHSPFLLMPDEKLTDKAHCLRILHDEPQLDRLENIVPNSQHLLDLIEKLLAKNPDERLGAGDKGYEEVKKHSFFASLNWSAVRLKVYDCLKRPLPVTYISLNFEKETIVSLDNSLNSNRKDFHFIAPDLQGNREIIEFHGFDQDILRDLPKPIQVNPTYDLMLKSDIYIRTSSVAEVIKQFIIPKKTVRFAKNVVQHEIQNNRNSNKNQVQRFSPYNSDQRKSTRIARRCTRSMSMSL